MELSYAPPKSTARHAYIFNRWEEKLIAESLQIQIKKRLAKIERIRSSPKNEGQASYGQQIKELQNEIISIQEIIDTMVQ